MPDVDRFPFCNEAVPSVTSSAVSVEDTTLPRSEIAARPPRVPAASEPVPSVIVAPRIELRATIVPAPLITTGDALLVPPTNTLLVDERAEISPGVDNAVAGTDIAQPEEKTPPESVQVPSVTIPARTEPLADTAVTPEIEPLLSCIVPSVRVAPWTRVVATMEAVDVTEPACTVPFVLREATLDNTPERMDITLSVITAEAVVPATDTLAACNAPDVEILARVVNRPFDSEATPSVTVDAAILRDDITDRPVKEPDDSDAETPSENVSACEIVDTIDVIERDEILS